MSGSTSYWRTHFPNPVLGAMGHVSLHHSGKNIDGINVTASQLLLETEKERLEFANAVREFLKGKELEMIIDPAHIKNPPTLMEENADPQYQFTFKFGRTVSPAAIGKLLPIINDLEAAPTALITNSYHSL